MRARNSPRADANPDEPRPPAGAPDLPAGLSPEAARAWRALVPLIGPGVLTRDNGQTLARYCHGLVRWWKMAEWLDAHDDTYAVTDQLGNTRHLRHPNVITYEKLGRDLMRIEQEMGLTPAARTRVHAIQQDAPKPERQSAPALRIAT